MASGRAVLLTAFSLSVSAHLGVLFAVGNAAGGNGSASGGAPSPAVVSTMTARLITEPENAPPVSASEEKAEAPALVAQAAVPVEETVSAQPQSAGAASPGSADEQGAGLPVLLPTGPRYFELSELSAQPQLVRDLVPGKMLSVSADVPRTVVLRLLINEQGSVDKVEFDDEGLPELLRDRVGELFAGLQFQPGKQGERMVKSQMKIEVTLEDVLPIERAATLAGSPATVQ